jgi:hypothetical protein
MWHAYDQVWASWRRFDQAFALALRYYKHLPKSIPREITNKLYDLEAVLRHDLSAEHVSQQADEIKRNIEKLLSPVYKL